MSISSTIRVRSEMTSWPSPGAISTSPTPMPCAGCSTRFAPTPSSMPLPTPRSMPVSPNEDLAFAVNGDAVGHLSAACELVGAHLVHVSTDYVFDGTLDRPYREDDATNPQSVYGRSKLAGEHAAGPGATIARTSWVCGEHGNNMVKLVLRLAADSDQALAFVDDQRGKPTFTADLARGASPARSRPSSGDLSRDQPGCGELVRVRRARSSQRPVMIPIASARSPPSTSTHRAPRPGPPTASSTTPPGGPPATNR